VNGSGYSEAKLMAAQTGLVTLLTQPHALQWGRYRLVRGHDDKCLLLLVQVVVAVICRCGWHLAQLSLRA
jgi:hypothetical protein